jgi:hypothetical protein
MVEQRDQVNDMTSDNGTIKQMTLGNIKKPVLKKAFTEGYDPQAEHEMMIGQY